MRTRDMMLLGWLAFSGTASASVIGGINQLPSVTNSYTNIPRGFSRDQPGTDMGDQCRRVQAPGKPFD